MSDPSILIRPATSDDVDVVVSFNLAMAKEPLTVCGVMLRMVPWVSPCQLGSSVDVAAVEVPN